MSTFFLHGDLHAGNLLANGGALTAAIDFGECGVGDPACDKTAGWWIFDGPSSSVFRTAPRVEDDMWMCARGWALSIALIAPPHYVDSSPVLAEMSRTAIRRIVSDVRSNDLRCLLRLSANNKALRSLVMIVPQKRGSSFHLHVHRSLVRASNGQEFVILFTEASLTCRRTRSPMRRKRPVM